uniref:Uncharacterized protein n=1 Tax=Panagrolaimus sp. ES5 TaxID=591445 RepID=A0AC34GWV2_9BILA
MVVHIGIDPWDGKLSYYKDAGKKTEHLEIKQVLFDENDKVTSLFKEIKTKVKDELGYLCICLNPNYGNSIRKLFVKEGLKCGFKNVEIIDWEIAICLNAMSHTNFTPLNGNIIWIFWRSAYIYVWEINEQKAKFCDKSTIYGINNSSLEAGIKNAFTKYKTPDVILYQEHELHKMIFEENLAEIKKHDCQLFTYIHNQLSTGTGSLLKARIKAGYRELAHLDVWNFLDLKIYLKYDNKEIISFDENQQLPIIYSGKISKKPNVNEIEIIPPFREPESIKLPENGVINFTFQIDTNGIYFLNFDKSPNSSHKSDTKLEKAAELKFKMQAKRKWLSFMYGK